QQYDLQNNTAVLNAKNKSELDQLEGQLKGFEDINEENIIVQNELLKTEKQKFEYINIEFKKAEETYRNLKNLKSDFELLNSKKENYNKLLEEKKTFDSLEIETELYDRIFRIFIPLISDKNKLH